MVILVDRHVHHAVTVACTFDGIGRVRVSGIERASGDEAVIFGGGHDNAGHLVLFRRTVQNVGNGPADLGLIRCPDEFFIGDVFGKIRLRNIQVV